MKTLSEFSWSDSLFWIVFYGLVGLSWLILIANGMDGLSSFSTLIDSICVSAAEASLRELAVMWGLMVLAMMLPTFHAHARIHQDIRSKESWPSHTFVLVLGFLLIWSILVVIGAFSQHALAANDLIDSSGRQTSLVGSALVLLFAGAYQFSSLKRACMTQCASPMHYFFKYWRDHHIGALQMGVHLGALCIGCCWALMALAFVGGTMNVFWMAILTGLMIFDKQHYFNQQWSTSVGWTLIVTGALVFVIALIFEVIV